MKTRKPLSILLILAMALGLLALLPITASAEGVDITADFTDPAFKAAVYEHIGKTAPAPIYDTDVAGISTLAVNNEGIKNLEGLKHFKTLDSLVCHSNQLTSLPALPDSLRALYCYDNQLTSLPALPFVLTILSCYNNQLTSLPALPSSLDTLACANNKLTSLPVLPSFLRELYCSNNQLTSLPELPISLKFLACANNQLTTIDVTGLALNRLHCYNNNMPDQSAVIGFNGIWGTEISDAFLFNPPNIITNPEPSFWAKLWNFILKWFLFGWIWMK